MLDGLLVIGGTIVAPEAFTRTIDKIRGSRQEYRDLRNSVRSISGHKPGRGYKKWFIEDATWPLLLMGRDESVEALVHSLDKYIKNIEKSTALVQATLLTLVESLKPARASAVVGARLSAQLNEIKNLIVLKTDLGTLLRRVVPAARPLLEALYKREPATAERLLSIATQDASPAAALRGLSAQPPKWLEDAIPEAWVVFVELADGYSLPDICATWLEKVAESGIDPGAMLARAAFCAAKSDDQVRADALIERAKVLDGQNRLVVFYDAALSGSADRIISVGRRISEPSIDVDSLLAEALYATEGVHSAITEYRRVVRTYPEYAGICIRLANLLGMSNERPSHSIFAEMRELAITARDLRRHWRSNSGEAVALLCNIEFKQLNWHSVMSFGRQAPHGEATENEESDPTVKILVGESAILVDQIELARTIADEMTNEFDRTLLHARCYAAEGGPIEEVAHMYMDAWSVASREDEKFTIQASLAAIGKPIPDREELEARDDVQARLILAQYESENENVDEALAMLRPWRNRASVVIEPMVHLYLKNDDTEAAFDTLEYASERYKDPRFLARLAILAAQRGAIERAINAAIAALSEIGDEPEIRTQLHEVLIQDAQSRGAWSTMAKRVRTLIDAHGATEDRRWWLVGALYNQRSFDEAWDAMRQSPPLGPNTVERAKVWIDLSVKFRTDTGLAEEMLSILERFSDSADFVGFVAGRFLTWSPHQHLPEGLTARWRARINRVIEENPEGASIFTIKLPDDPEDPEALIEALRPFLEPGAAQKQELLQSVAKGEMPYGMISASVNKPYVASLILNAAGHYNVEVANSEISTQELMIARESIRSSFVVDGSALNIQAIVQVAWPKVVECAQQMVTTSWLKADVVQSLDHLNLDSETTMGWNVREGRPYVTDTDPAALEVLRSRCRWITEASESLDIVEWTRLTRVVDDAEMQGDARFLPWLSPLDYALANGKPLYADDAVLRGLARALGVPTFGTYAILRALADIGALEDAEFFACLDTMRRGYCVDLPFDAISVHRIAHFEGWVAGAASYIFTRSAAWLDYRRTFGSWHAMITNVAAESVDQLPAWLYRACCGVCESRVGSVALKLVSMLLLDAALVAKADSSVFANLLGAVRAAADVFDLPDILPQATSYIYGTMTNIHGPARGASEMLQMASGLAPMDRDAVRRLVFSASG